MSRKRRADPQSSEEEDDDSVGTSGDSISSDSIASSDEESSSDEEEIINCDFEFFDPQKQDFLGIKHLLRQLFDTDADLFDLAELAEMILAQPLLGSTVKTDGNEGDPLSFLTVLNLRTHTVLPLCLRKLTYRINQCYKLYSSIFSRNRNPTQNFTSGYWMFWMRTMEMWV